MLLRLNINRPYEVVPLNKAITLNIAFGRLQM